MKLRDLLHIALITTTLFSTSLQVRADAYDDGMSAYQSGGYNEAIAQWKPLAEHGNTQAAYNLGFMHEFGYGVAANDDESFKWYLRAAQQGHAQAQRSVAWMYERGKGVAQDRAQATRWMDISALTIEQDSASNEDMAMEKKFLDELSSQLNQAATRYDTQRDAGIPFPQELEASNHTS